MPALVNLTPEFVNSTPALIILMVAINERRCADDERRREINERKTEDDECNREFKERRQTLIILASEFFILSP